MKRILLLLCLIGLLGFAWHERGLFRSVVKEAQKPVLPVEQSYQAPTTTQVAPVATSTRVKTATPMADPLAWEGSFPTSVNLAVPFLSQAPKMNWDMPYQEACEEASMLMVDAYYRGQTRAFTPEDGDRAILDLVAFEGKKGKPPDLTAQETADIIKQKFGYKRVIVRPLISVSQIKAALANGYPVIIPADGKALGNPNFRNGGPPYHMLVVKGYVGDQYWITNDPGTRKGKDFTYNMPHLMKVVHDWNGGDVPHGKPYLIVVLPNEEVK